jgi:hypothetical protein
MSSRNLLPKNVLSSGALVQANFANGFAIFTGYDLRPSDVRSARITIANPGSLAGTFKLFEVEASNSFVANDLTLLIVDERESTEVYRGDIGDFPLGGIDLGSFEPGEQRTYRFTAFLAIDSPDGGQGRGAGAIYEWGAESGGTGESELCSKTPTLPRSL